MTTFNLIVRQEFSVELPERDKMGSPLRKHFSEGETVGSVELEDGLTLSDLADAVCNGRVSDVPEPAVNEAVPKSKNKKRRRRRK